MLQDTYTISELFTKRIDRNINGVIQAGQLDEATRDEELREYVMTQEIEENMAYFYQNYVKSIQEMTTAVGVWISGFFGSGKSHFLKILSYLLDSQTVYGKKPVDYFPEKTDNEVLLEQMQQVATYDLHAILFNIDSKASVSSRPGDDKEMIVEVFLKAFNEHLGYSSTLWIADIERQIAEASDYQGFKKAFLEVDGTPWEKGRNQIRFKRKSFLEALNRIGVDQATGESLLAGGNQNFSISSEEFAQLVAAHCEQQGPQYRLTFFVDEIGQYIGDNRRLMLNLQTVVEDLGKSCRGQVWVVVTAQEQLDSLTKIAGYDDYSKIQGRFPTRINLTSSNTDEVIQRRLLEKTEPAKDALLSRYELDKQSLQNLLAFDKDMKLGSGYESEEKFVQFYPFIPYQIDLLQKVFEKVRRQGEVGKHLAHGERSLLNSVQEVALQLKDEGTDRLVRFSQFYGTIRRFLDSSIAHTITKAQDREGITPFDLEVLQVLYMIKGIKEVPATITNLTTLLIGSIDSIKKDVENEVRHSLHRLQKAILIQKNADQTFTFLSNDEQEIQREVEHTRINEANLDAKLAREFFNEIYSASRVMYRDLPFDFNKQFNGYIRGTSLHEMTLYVVTREMTEEEARLKSHSGVAIMRIPDELAETFEEPLRYAERLETYLRIKNFPAGEQYDHIRRNLQEQRGEFEQEARRNLVEACREATFYINGKDYTFSGNVEHQVEQALLKLVENTFPKLGYISTPVPTKEIRETILQWGKEGTPFTNHLAFDEMLHVLERELEQGLKQIYETFTRSPYGWSEQDVAGMVAGLDQAGKIELAYLNEPFTVDHPSYPERLLRKGEWEKVRLKVKEGLPPRIRGAISELLQEVFNHYQPVDTYQDGARLLKGLIHEQLTTKADPILAWARQAHPDYPYPDGNKVQRMQQYLEGLLQIHDPKAFLQEVTEEMGEIEDIVEELEYIHNFYKGKGRELFDQGVDLLTQRASDLLAFDRDPVVVQTKEAMEGILRDSNPYRKIPDLAKLCEQLTKRLDELVAEEAKKAASYIKEVISAVEELHDQYQDQSQAASQIAALQSQVKKYQEAVKESRDRGVLNTYKEKATQDLQQLQQEIARLSDVEVVHFSLAKLIPSTGKQLNNEAELDDFLEELRSQLQQTLQENKKITITR